MEVYTPLGILSRKVVSVCRAERSGADIALLGGELDEDKLDAFDELPTDSPSVQYIKEHLGAYFSNIDPAFLKQETQLQALLDNFHWTEDHQEKMQQLNQCFVQHVSEHPEEYQQLLVLGERLAALASFPEDSPQVGQLVEDIVQYFESYPFLLELQMQFPQLKSP